MAMMKPKALSQEVHLHLAPLSPSVVRSTISISVFAGSCSVCNSRHSQSSLLTAVALNKSFEWLLGLISVCAAVGAQVVPPAGGGAPVAAGRGGGGARG